MQQFKNGRGLTNTPRFYIISFTDLIVNQKRKELYVACRGLQEWSRHFDKFISKKIDITQIQNICMLGHNYGEMPFYDTAS